MSTSVTFNGTSYSIPAAGELNWTSLSNFLIDVGQHAGLSTIEKQAIRVATTTPITVSATTDFCVVSNLGTPGAVAVTLPAGINGQLFVICDGKGDANTNNITITPNGSDTISGSSTLVLNQNRQVVVLQYSTTNTVWNVIGGYYTALANALVNPMTTSQDIVVGGASGAPGRLAKGSNSTLLGINGSGNVAYATLTDAYVSASAAIAGSKISPDFVAQTVATTGLVKLGSNGGTDALVVDARDTSSTPSITSTDAFAYWHTGNTNTGKKWVAMFESSGSGTGTPYHGVWIDTRDNAGASNYLLRITTNSASTESFSVRGEGSVFQNGNLLQTSLNGSDHLITVNPAAGNVTQNWVVRGSWSGGAGVTERIRVTASDVQALGGLLKVPQGANSGVSTAALISLAGGLGTVAADNTAGEIYMSANGLAGTTAATANFRITSVGRPCFRTHDTTAATTPLGILQASDGQLFRSTSSLRYKTDVTPLTKEQARAVLQLQAVNFKSTAGGDDPEKIYQGLIAEDVHKVVPDLAYHAPVKRKVKTMRSVVNEHGETKEIEDEIEENTDEMQVEGVDYVKLPIYHNELIKELYKTVRSLQKRVVALEKGSAK
jgi:hypothetical protein